MNASGDTSLTHDLLDSAFSSGALRQPLGKMNFGEASRRLSERSKLTPVDRLGEVQSTFPIKRLASKSEQFAWPKSSGFNYPTGTVALTVDGNVDLSSCDHKWKRHLQTSFGNAGQGTIAGASTTTVTAANTTPLLTQEDRFTVNVAAASCNPAPDGTVTITVDGTAVATPVTLLNEEIII